jgi:hypothetical protein
MLMPVLLGKKKPIGDSCMYGVIRAMHFGQLLPHAAGHYFNTIKPREPYFTRRRAAPADKSQLDD